LTTSSGSAEDGAELTVVPSEPTERARVVDLLARALLDNPSNIAMFPQNERRRLRSIRALYSVMLSDLAQPPLIGRLSGRIVGASVVAMPERCFYRRSQAHARTVRVGGRQLTVESPRVPLGQLLRLLSVGPGALQRAAVMGRSGSEHDPTERHWHVELVGVEKELRGQGIGRRLMEAALRQTDHAHEPAYLETDTVENVRFYERLGFEVVAEARPLDTPIWHMQRAPAN